MRVEDKNLNEIRFRSDVYKMLSESGKSASYAIPDSKFDNFSEREFEEKVAPILGHSVHFCLDKCDNFYHPKADGGISILDDSLGIDWKIPTEHANLSEKDTKHAMLKDFDSPFDINVDLYK